MSTIKRKRKITAFDAGVTVLSLLALLLASYPLYYVLIASISDPAGISSGKVILFPRGVNFTGYKYIFQEGSIWLGYKNTIFYTTFGTALGVIVTLLAGYALSRKDLAGRKIIMIIMVLTMYFQGGLIPTYLVVNKLGLVNTPFVLVILGSVWVYNIIITRTFFQTTLPEELLEAAIIDGCGNFRFFISIALPLSKTVIAVITLYYAVGHWNSYFNALIYTTRKSLYPLQLILREILVTGQQTVSSLDSSELESLAEKQKIAESIKYGIIVVASLPIISMYPFLQKYFVKGVMVGAVKG